MAANNNVFEAPDEDSEELDTDLFVALSQIALNQGTMGMLTFSKDASPENAFFMQPEEESINQNVLFIHASVSLMKQYLREVASPEFGKSKERVAKVISMF